MKSIKIALIEPFYTGSHQAWCEGFQQNSLHQIEIISMEGRHWKWRMHGGAISIAKKLKDVEADLLVVSDMIDLALFRSFLPQQLKNKRVHLYMHENQLTYPWSPQDVDIELKRDKHYGFLNYTSALSADQVFFNSAYHLQSFMSALPEFLGAFPDHRNMETIDQINEKSRVLHLGMDLRKFDRFRKRTVNEVPVIVWNHRWEYDKDPDTFFQVLFELKDDGVPYQLVVLGESYSKLPPIFEKAKVVLSDRILHWGYTESFEEYANWLWQADVTPVTSVQDFFGGSVVEAMYCDCYPLLPNRLAYPEHVSQEYLYEPEELKTRLKDVLLNRPTFDGSYLIKYDWNNCVGQYDASMLS